MSKEAIIKGIEQGDVRSLSKAITLAESRNPQKFETALEILEHFKPNLKSIRLGISGTPGVGKSTFINRYCKEVLLHNPRERIAILSIDPSSKISKGSILGDKTRMPDLINEPGVYIRPTSSGDQHGGLSRNSRLAVLLCEAAGFNRIIIESVGVGQGETEISMLCDLFVLLLNPGGGDDLQGIKRGIVEMADLIVVNKADGESKNIASQTAKDYQLAQHLMHGKDQAEVLICSALNGFNMDVIRKRIDALFAKMSSGSIKAKRNAQSAYWVKRNLESYVMEKLIADPSGLETELKAGKLAERIAFELSKTL